MRVGSGTFKGRYDQCNDCTHKIFDGVKYNCNYSHSQIRRNTNGSGVHYERFFRFCGLYTKNTNYLKYKGADYDYV